MQTIPQEATGPIREDKAAWNNFVAVIRGFVGDHKAESRVELVETLVKNCDMIRSVVLKREVGGRQTSARSQMYIKRTKWIISYKEDSVWTPSTPDYAPGHNGPQDVPNCSQTRSMLNFCSPC